MEPTRDRVSAAIDAVVARFGVLVRGVGVRRGMAEADLDEVLQDVRIRLWRAEQNGKDLEELGSSYLYQTATSAALDLLRRRRAHGASRTDGEDGLLELPAAAPTPHERAEARELGAQIEKIVATLPADRRIAVRFHLAGYDRHDIARMLGWSEARARNLLYRGLDDLRRRLAATGITPARAS